MTDPIHNESANADDQESPLLDFLLVLARHKRLVIGLPLVVAILSAGVAFLLPKWYSATAKIMPPQQTQSNAVAILGQLGALAGGAASQALGLKNPSDIYVAMLKSRTIADALITRFDLLKVYDEDELTDARREFAKHVVISAGREGIISIEVEDRDPKRAAALANAYVDELRARTLSLAVSEAGQRRLFFEAQLKKSKGDLVTAELELKRFSQEKGLLNPQGQLSISVAAAASLRGQIAAKEIQLAAMRSFATDENPELKRVLQELKGLRGELAKMEKDASAGKGDVLLSFDKAADVGLEYARRYRDFKYQETLFEVLAKQYEIARIDESKDATLIQVLDAAIQPERKSRPKRWLVVLMSALAALICGVLAAHLLEYVRDSSKDPRVQSLLRQFRFRPRSG